MKTEAFNEVRTEVLEAAYVEPVIPKVPEPPSFVGYLIKEWIIEVNEDAEAGSTIELESAYATDPDEVSVEMIFAGTNSMKGFAKVEVITDNAFTK